MSMPAATPALLAPAPERRLRPLSYFEFWPGWLFYAPVIVHWILLGLRYLDFSLPTAANPMIATGGLCGESKTAILDLVGPSARDLIAPYATVTARADGLADVERAMAQMELQYPVVLKPDIACNGTGVRLAHSRDDVTRYLEAFPSGEHLVVQDFVDTPHEAGLFYIRRPDEPLGRITSVTLKTPPVVTGDGRSSLHALILADERASRVSHLYVGRIDVRFTSVSALCRGAGFKVIEINGVGSEATDIWDRRTKLLDAWQVQFFHYGEAFRIGAANRRRGFRSAGLRAMYRDWRKQQRLMAAYPPND
jgi:hypothetical protein